MGREIRRVPLDFDFPLDKTWTGFLTPDELHENPCPDCKGGNSKRAEYLFDLWYGNVPFDPASTGSTPWTAETPAVRAGAERNITQAPDYYGTGERAIVWEANRLAKHYNTGWCHHLSQEDVDALLAADRLWEFTRKVVPGKGWVKLESPKPPTAAEVNEWSLTGFGHDGINASICVRERCKREGVDDTCSTCGGHGSLEAYPGQRKDRDAWEPTDPPTGDGWQLWQTVSEGGPISPVCTTPEELACWMASPAYTWGASKHSSMSYENALAFVKAGWAPSLVSTAEHGVEPGEVFIGRTGQEEMAK